MTLNVFNLKFKCLIAVSLFFLSQKAFSQSPGWMSEYEVKELEKMNLTYKKPKKFDEILGHKPYKNDQLQTWLEYEYNKLQSKDNRFIAFINVS